MQDSHLVHVCTLKRLDEGLPEVVTEEGVEQWVEHRVGIAHHGDDLEQLV